MIDIQMGPFTRKEAEEATEQFIQTGCRMRHMILDLYERKAHSALGYGDDFERYTHERLGVTFKSDYLRQLQMWARVERDVSVDTPRTLPQNIAYELAKLPGEKRAGAYEEALALNGSGKGGLPDVKHIVTRLLNGGSPAPTASPKTILPLALAKTAEPEPEVPVGAIVDVRTGRPVNPVLRDVTVNVESGEVADIKTGEVILEAIEPVDPFSKEIGGEPIHNDELGYMSDAGNAQLRQFRLYWSLGSDIETVEKALAALHVIYSHKPAFQRHAPDFVE